MEVHDADLVLDGVHGGVVHDVLDTLLLGDLKKLAPIIGGSKFFSGGYKYELVLDILDGHRLDEDGVDGGGDEGLHPGDGVGGDRAVDHVVLSQAALVQGHSLRVSFNFYVEGEVVVTT